MSDLGQLIILPERAELHYEMAEMTGGRGMMVMMVMMVMMALSPLTLGSPCSGSNDTIVDRPSGLIGSRHQIL